MPTWIIIVILLSIAATAFLASVLQRINAPRRSAHRGAGGDAGVFAAGGGGRGDKHDNDSGDSGGDGGGGGD